MRENQSPFLVSVNSLNVRREGFPSSWECRPCLDRAEPNASFSPGAASGCVVTREVPCLSGLWFPLGSGDGGPDPMPLWARVPGWDMVGANRQRLAWADGAGDPLEERAVDACFLTLGSPSLLQGRGKGNLEPEPCRQGEVSMWDQGSFLLCPVVSVMPLASETWGRAAGPWGFLYLEQWFMPLHSRRGSCSVASPGSKGRRVAACGFSMTCLHPFYLSGGGGEVGLCSPASAGRAGARGGVHSQPVSGPPPAHPASSPELPLWLHGLAGPT